VDGRVGELSALLEAHPRLVHARSEDAHGATLLHHVAANGVPDELQRTPENAVEVARLLLERGAEPDALSGGFGGGPVSTTLCLLVSSWPPFERGLQPDLVRALVAGGARPDGVGGEGLPLATALTFGYTGAAETLAELGAPCGHPLAAAGLGRLEAVKRWHRERAPEPDEVDPWTPLFGRALDGRRSSFLQESLHLAVTHGRIDVAAWLIDQGASARGRTPGQHSELPLLQAVFVREFDAARLLLAAGADADERCPKRGESARQHAAGIDRGLPDALGF
jgi:hypothetical protein